MAATLIPRPGLHLWSYSPTRRVSSCMSCDLVKTPFNRDDRCPKAARFVEAHQNLEAA